jgi:hypothetical protein
MDEKNYISNSTLVRQKFNNLFKSTGQEPFTDNTIHRCFSGLAKVELLRKAKGRGLYQVNPLFLKEVKSKGKVIREQLEEIELQSMNTGKNYLFKSGFL